jgi:hypothetical protein
MLWSGENDHGGWGLAAMRTHRGQLQAGLKARLLQNCHDQQPCRCHASPLQCEPPHTAVESSRCC